MIKPTTDEILRSFVPVEMQIRDMQNTLEFVYNKDLAHQYCFYDDDGPILLAGMVEVADDVYDTYTIFSDKWKPGYFKYFSRAFKGYIKHVSYDIILHVVSNERPWTHKMIKMFGFEKYKDAEDHTIYAIGGV